MAEIKTVYKDAPNYTEKKKPVPVPFYEQKSFKSYVRLNEPDSQATAGGTIVISDDVDSGGEAGQ